MNKAEIIYKLRNDFPFAVMVIVNNNTEAILKNLNEVFAGNYETKESMINTILELKEAGQDDLVNRILSVPFKTSNATPEMLAAWRTIQSQAGSASAGMRTDATTTTASEPGGFASWSGGMFSALGQIGSAWLGGQQPTQTGIQPPVYVGEPAKRNNTIWWVIGGFVALLLIVGVVVAMRKK